MTTGQARWVAMLMERGEGPRRRQAPGRAGGSAFPSTNAMERAFSQGPFVRCWALAVLATAAVCSSSGLIAGEGLRRETDDQRVHTRLTTSPRAGNLVGQAKGGTFVTVETLLGGMEWLRAAQNPSGSWGSVYEFADSTAVVETLGNIEPLGHGFQGGSGWLTAQPAADLDELSRSSPSFVDTQKGVDNGATRGSHR
jgi:hypothetical protein